MTIEDRKTAGSSLPFSLCPKDRQLLLFSALLFLFLLFLIPPLLSLGYAFLCLALVVSCFSHHVFAPLRPRQERLYPPPRSPPL